MGKLIIMAQTAGYLYNTAELARRNQVEDWEKIVTEVEDVLQKFYNGEVVNDGSIIRYSIIENY